MVASYETGDIVQSFVRVPGSGSDRSLPSSCCDLGRTSTLAAMVPVSAHLPAAIANRTPTTQEKEEKMASKRKLGDDSGVKLTGIFATQKHPQHQRRKILVGKRQILLTTTINQRKLFLKLINNQTQNSNRVIYHLLQQLYQENVQLKQKLLLFQQLFQNKNRLRSVVQRFGIETIKQN